MKNSINSLKAELFKNETLTVENLKHIKGGLGLLGEDKRREGLRISISTI